MISVTPYAKISGHFTLAEAIHSEWAERNDVPNTIDNDELLQRVIRTARQMEQVRVILGYGIKVNSWYRSPKVNAGVGGSKTSEHMLGTAVDFICPNFGSPYDIVKFLIPHMKSLMVNQLIYEYTWVHISFELDPTKVPKNQVLTYLGKGKYIAGLAHK